MAYFEFIPINANLFINQNTGKNLTQNNKSSIPNNYRVFYTCNGVEFTFVAKGVVSLEDFKKSFERLSTHGGFFVTKIIKC